MSDGNGNTENIQGHKTKFNIVKWRGDPTTATTLSGHHVEKKERVIIPSPFDGTMITLLCADYHMEHFVYIDPLFELELDPSEEMRYWFAMCTCGAKAVIIGPADAAIHQGHTASDVLEGKSVRENMLVCEHYMGSLLTEGHGYHQGQDPRPWT
jgi:hypothetical protein